MKKYILTAAAAALLMLPSGAGAAKLSAVQSSGFLTVTADAQREEKSLSVILTVTDGSGRLIFADDSYTDDSGKYTLVCNVKNSDGILGLYARIGEEEAELPEVYIRTEAMENDLSEKLKGSDAQALKEAMTAYYPALELDDELYNTLSDKDAVFPLMISDGAKTSAKSYDDFKNIFYRAVILEKYNESTSKNAVCGLMTASPYREAFPGLFCDNYGALSDKIKAYVTEDMEKTYKDAAVFADDIEFSVLRCAVKYSSLWTNVQKFLNNYSEKIGLDSAATSGECKNVVGNDYSTYEEIRKAMKGSGSSGSSGGGGSSGKKGSGITAARVNPGVSEDTEVKSGKSVFTDMDDCKWADEAVAHIYGLGIVNGSGDSRFEPLRSVTRAEAVKMLMILIKRDKLAPPDYLPFEDVEKSGWSYPYIANAYACGIVNGKSENLFGTNDPVTRQEMAVIAWNAMKLCGFEEKSRGAFADSESIAPWARDAVEILCGADILHGREVGGGLSFVPNDSLTRAEAAVMISNIAKQMP